MLDLLHLPVILAAAVCLFVPAVRRPELRGGLLALGFVFLAAAVNECEPLLHSFKHRIGFEPELVPIALALVLSALCAWIWRGSTVTAVRAIWRNRRFPLLVWGLLFVSFIPNLAKNKRLWALMVGADGSTHAVREVASVAVTFVGHLLLLNWAVLFLRDKFRRPQLRQSPLAHLVFENELVEVGRGTRRVAYKVGDTGYCVKFYYPQEQCIEALKMQKSIQRDVKWRRFNKYRNSSSAEVYVYDRFRHSMPQAIRDLMPPVCQRVFHPVWGWGVIETLYTNPDGTAILPYEDEIRRQTPENRAKIYAMAQDLLKRLIAIGARFYEPGNFHVLIRPDGGLELKLIDFEPESKTAIPLEMFSARLRSRKLARKAKRYLAHLRKAYGIVGKSLEHLMAESALGTSFSSFTAVKAGNSSKNYKAVTAEGFAYFIKFAPADVVEQTVGYCRQISSPYVAALAFGGRSGFAGGRRVCAFDWREGGTSVHPADMTPAQVSSLVRAYGEFARSLQAVGDLDAAPDPEGLSFGMAPGVIHGDLHCGNIFFTGEAVTAFMDFEKLRRGWPTEDLLRVFVHAMERTRFWRCGRMARMEANFAACVRESPYPAEAWLAAVGLYEARKGRHRARKARSGWLAAAERLLRAPLYRRLRRIVRREKGGRP